MIPTADHGKVMSEQARVIPVILFCPHCHKQHVDEGIWATKPHRTHVCVDDAVGPGCGKPFTPSTFRTVGVLDLKAYKMEVLDEEPKT